MRCEEHEEWLEVHSRQDPKSTEPDVLTAQPNLQHIHMIRMSPTGRAPAFVGPIFKQNNRSTI